MFQYVTKSDQVMKKLYSSSSSRTPVNGSHFFHFFEFSNFDTQHPPETVPVPASAHFLQFQNGQSSARTSYPPF